MNQYLILIKSWLTIECNGLGLELIRFFFFWIGVGTEEKRPVHANFGAHLFAGVGEMSGSGGGVADGSDLNLDSPGDTANGCGEKLKDKEQSIKYVVNGILPHGIHSVNGSPVSAGSNGSSTLNGLNGEFITLFYSLDLFLLGRFRIPELIGIPEIR